MIVQLKNDCLTVAISDIGAELQSVRGADETEYIWQGDKASWADRAPVLFPFCGRLWDGKCTDAGISCNPGVHGFLRFMTTEVTEKSDTSVTFRARDNAETLKNYPYPFEVRLTFSLQDRTLTTRTEIVNRGERVMPFALGLHPGFSLPFAGGTIGDYTVRFEGATGILQRLNFDEGECFPTGGSRDFPLRDGEFFDPTDAFFRSRFGVLLRDAALGYAGKARYRPPHCDELPRFPLFRTLESAGGALPLHGTVDLSARTARCGHRADGKARSGPTCGGGAEVPALHGHILLRR